LWEFVKDNDLYVFLTSAAYRAIRRRHAGERPNQKRAMKYLLASGATAITFIERDGLLQHYHAQ